MRRIGAGLLIAALLLAVARLWTGVVYRADEPVAALVLKRRPSLAIERTETPAQPLAGDIVLDREEPGLFYAGPYLWSMHAAPALAAVMVAIAAILLARGGRRA